ncbi:intraflagellar transport protein 80 homolog isoform X2 [Planococcus citri]|uniref:intraflagellar transport protein 80 homolog isoform X2 n=1 Tax=Planococcus citri TaxID=170843 RepID=UPI0031F768B8
MTDDRVLLKWNLFTKDSIKLYDFPENAYPIDLHCFVRNQGGLKRQKVEQILLTSADGKFHIIGKNGRTEKTADAHRGAVLVGKWSSDGSSLLTGGEDGQIKIWSKSGMLRSTVVQESTPIYSAAWSPDSNQILYTSNKMLIIKTLSGNVKSNRWKAHEGLILKVSWNSNNNLIVSGSEDCRYKVWDTYGRQLYSSVVHDYPITSLDWAPSGDLFAIGSFNTLRLCDRAGWSHCLEMPNSDSIYSISWSSDGTQVACACANGNLLVAHIIERRYEWLNYELLVTSRKCLQVKDISGEVMEKLDFPERIIHVVIRYKRIVVATPTQCHIFNVNNFNTPHIMELKEGCVMIILMAEKVFALVEPSSVNIYSYDGRNASTPKWPNMLCDLISDDMISLSNDTLAIRDQIDDKVIHLLEIGSSVNPPPFTHKIGVTDLALNQAGSIQNRQLAFIDKNRDLYILSVPTKAGISSSRKIDKLGIMVQSIFWNHDYNTLAGIQETTLTVWYYPGIVFVDPRLLRRSTLVKDTSEFGRNPSIVNFIRNHVNIRRSDGSLINSCTSPFMSILHSYGTTNNWKNALKLCRSVKDEILWTCLAGLAIFGKELDTAEEAYAAIDLLDKVSFIQYIKTIKNKSIQAAELALLGGNTEDAESILLQNGLIFRAVYLNICTHRWLRALELAMKHKTHVDTVLLHRQKYLRSFDKVEKNSKFLQFTEMELDENTIEQKVKLEFQKENTVTR